MRYLLFLMIIVSASCSPLLPVTTTNGAKSVWLSHKRIAVVPLRISSPDNKKLSPREFEQEMINMQKLSFSILNNINSVLKRQYDQSNLSVQLMSSDSVLMLLGQNGYNYNSLPHNNLNQYCKLLKVDAVITGDVEFLSPEGFAFLVLLRPAYLPDPGIEKARVVLSVYDKNSAKPIWKFSESNTAKDYNKYYRPSNIINVSNEEYLIAYMFDKAMKALPYVINSPLKRNY